MTSADQLRSRPDKVGAVLVHGVGDEQRGVVLKLCEPLLGQWLPPECVIEANWNDTVARPLSQSSEAGEDSDGIRLTYVAGLTRSMQFAAHLGATATVGPSPSRSPTMRETLAAAASTLPILGALSAIISWKCLLALGTAWLLIGGTSWFALGVGAASRREEHPWLVATRTAVIAGVACPLASLACAASRAFRTSLFVVLSYKILGLLNALKPEFRDTIDTPAGPALTLPWWGGAAILVMALLAGGGSLMLLSALERWVLRHFWIPIKVLNDVFRYLGDESYRQRVQAQVLAAILELQKADCTRVFLLTHSLGTVITYDVLRAHHGEFANLELVFVTAGSPLKRMFSRFFPLQYPPGDRLEDELYKRLGARLRWVNVYRPRDFVGGRLNLSGSGDCSTAQVQGFIQSHCDYWSDHVVYDAVRSVLHGSHQPREATTVAQTAPSWDSLPVARMRRWAMIVAGTVFTSVVVAGPVAGDLFDLFTASIDADRVRHGREAAGTLSYQRVHTSNQGRTPDRVRTSLTVEFRAFGELIQASPSRLLTNLPAVCRGLGSASGVEDVRVRFVPSDPTVFSIVGFERSDVPSALFWGTLCERVFGMGFLVPIAWWLWIVLGAPLSAATTGHAIEDGDPFRQAAGPPLALFVTIMFVPWVTCWLVTFVRASFDCG